jgi:hypothetical protein
MNKRVLSAVLWFFAGWYVANFVAAIFGVSFLLGPLVGTAAAALIGGDPFGVIWSSSRAFSSPARSLSASHSHSD